MMIHPYYGFHSILHYAINGAEDFLKYQHLKYSLGGLYKCLVGVHRVSGHGDDSAVEFGEVIHPV